MIKTWLYCCALMVVMMITIGGFTRLSNAGLSIVEWKPITGTLPPLSGANWEEEFSKYKQSPEYKILNSHISLTEFKDIFWLEFIHRFVARLTGLIICIPLLYFYFSKTIPFQNNKSYLLLPILLLAQGVMGWYMVKSGLASVPYVSHFRLAVHMMLAILLYNLIINKLIPSNQKNSRLKILTTIFIYIQIFVGALVAGLDAGQIYNTFPLMGGQIVPVELYNTSSILSDPASVQFVHRLMACVVTVSCFILAYKSQSLAVFIAIILQLVTGIITLLYNVPLLAALMHQLCAVFLLTGVLFTKIRI